MVIILILCTAVLVLHYGITKRFPARRMVDPPATAKLQFGTESQPAEMATGAAQADSASTNSGQAHLDDCKPSVAESLSFLARSPQIQCLGVMSLSQGLTTNLLDLAWKTQLHMLHPSPTAYAVTILVLQAGLS